MLRNSLVCKIMFLRLPVVTITPTYTHLLQIAEMDAKTILASSIKVYTLPLLLITFDIQNSTWNLKIKQFSKGNTLHPIYTRLPRLHIYVLAHLSLRLKVDYTVLSQIQSPCI